MKLATGMQVDMADGTTHHVHHILTKGDRNIKLKKGAKRGYITAGLPMAPAKLSGYQVCPHSTAGCRAACIYESGHAMIFGMINRGRTARARAWFQQRDEFKARLMAELGLQVKLAAKKRKLLAVRLNVFSDLIWERLAPELFEAYPTIQFYDYTKNAVRMRRYLDGQLPPNYWLTFSRSERNEADCVEVLKRGGNVAVVFDCGANNRHQHTLRPLPATWQGFEVINGDETDLRFLDKKGTVVGLFAKFTRGNKKGIVEGFIVPN
jgi:hypothetical protein